MANLTRGGAAAVVALLLPPILVRHMPAASYAVWVLALQAAAYVAYLDFGLQTAIGRYIAYANEKRDIALRDGVFSTALAGLTLAGALGFLLVVGIALASHRIFPSIPSALLPALRITMLIVGFGTALSMPGSAWSGIFIGLQRFEIPALANGTGKLLSAIALIWAAITGKSLVFMAFIMAVASLYSYGTQFLAQRRVAPGIHFNATLITRPVIRELFGYCFSLSIWSFSMLLVNGFDLILVGRFQFSAVTPYSVSATLITFLAGVQIAIFGVIMPHAAELHAQENPTALGKLLIKTTRLGLLILLLNGLPLIVFATPIIKVWIGVEFAKTGGTLLAILVAANIVRLIGTPYASILLGTGQQRLVIISPLMEGVTNLLCSIFLGWKFGAVGVAWGTMIGALVGMLANIFYNLPRTRRYVDVGLREYINRGILIPSVAFLPVLATAIYHAFKSDTTLILWVISLGCSLCLSILMMMRSIPQNRRA